jgi:class 3 adenylate cyclase
MAPDARRSTSSTPASATPPTSRAGCAAWPRPEIVVSESTRDRLEGTGIGLEPLSPVHVKGKKDALRLYRVRFA